MSQENIEELEGLEEETEELEDVEPELDDEGNPVGEEVPLFMRDEEEDDDLTASEPVPLGALLKHKRKAKEANEELERIKAELNELKKHQSPPPQNLKRPLRDDFDTDEEYHSAADEYDEAREKNRERQRQQEQVFARVQQRREQAVETFVERADRLVAKHKIDPTAYADAVGSVREVVEAAFPALGENAYPDFLSGLEDDDEATLFTIGKSPRQKELLAKKLREDPSGIKAMKHIARLTERNMGAKPKTSKAPKPAAVATGGDNSGVGKEGAWRKKYLAAGAGTQKAYDIKKAAKAAGVDTSKF